MTKISKSGIAPQQQIKSEHLLRIINALSGDVPNTTIEVSGSVTASYFVGDGSQLTNLPTSSGGGGTGSQDLDGVLGQGNTSSLGAQVYRLHSDKSGSTTYFDLQTGSLRIGDFGDGQGTEDGGDWYKYFAVFDPINDNGVINGYVYNDNGGKQSELWIEDNYSYLYNYNPTGSLSATLYVNEGLVYLRQRTGSLGANLYIQLPEVNNHNYYIPASTLPAKNWYLPLTINGVSASADGAITLPITQSIGNFLEGYTETGSRISGTIQVGLGDHDNSGNKTRYHLRDNVKSHEWYVFNNSGDSTPRVYAKYDTTGTTHVYNSGTSSGSISILGGEPRLSFNKIGTGIVNFYFNTNVPAGTTNFILPGISTANSYTVPIIFTDGTSSISASSAGIIEMQNLNLGGTSTQPTSTIDTGNTIDLSNPLINYCNMATPNTETAYTASNVVLGGKAKMKFQTSTEPELSGSVKESGATFISGTIMYMIIENNGEDTVYSFLTI